MTGPPMCQMHQYWWCISTTEPDWPDNSLTKRSWTEYLDHTWKEGEAETADAWCTQVSFGIGGSPLVQLLLLHIQLLKKIEEQV